MKRDVFTTIYLVGLTASSIVRVRHRLFTRGAPVVVNREAAAEILLMSQAALGMVIIPLVYVFTPVLARTDYRLPTWTAWIGTVVFAIGVWLLWCSHAALRGTSRTASSCGRDAS